MIKLDPKIVEAEIIKVIDELNAKLKTGAAINSTCSPGNIFSSQVLVDIMPSLEDALDITIPLKEYIFFDKAKHKQLTIKEATEKLIKIAKDGK